MNEMKINLKTFLKNKKIPAAPKFYDYYDNHFFVIIFLKLKITFLNLLCF